MLTKDELWVIDEMEALDDELSEMLPEVKDRFERELGDDDLGLRSLLETPEAMMSAWEQTRLRPRASLKGKRRQRRRAGISHAG